MMADTQSRRDTDEVELSAEDLRELSQPARAPSEAVRQDVGTSQAGTHSDSQRPRSHDVPTAKSTGSRTYIAIGAVVIALVGVISSSLIRDPGASDVTTHRWTPLAQPEPAPIEAPEKVPEGPPVRIRNAFDEREVFEFPPGTSRAEARAAVAEILLKRATERESKR